MNGPPLLQLLSSAVALAGALGCGQLAWAFWGVPRERRAVGRAFGVFFFVLTVGFLWLAVLDILVLTLDAPVISRGPWRPLVFRGLVAGAAWSVLYRVRRAADRR